MPQPGRVALFDALVPARRSSSILLVALSAVSLAELSAGFLLLVRRWQDVESGPLLAPAGVVLVLCGLVQARLSWIAWQAGRLTAGGNPLRRFAFCRSLLIGSLVAYLAALMIGPVRHVGCAWMAAVCTWLTCLLLPLAATPSVAEGWRKWTQGHSARRLAWLVYASILLLIAGEVSLRAHRVARDGQWFGGATSQVGHLNSMVPVSPEDEAFAVRVASMKPARFRVAILGDRAARGRKMDGYLARVEQSMPGVEVVPLDASFAAPAGNLAAQIETCSPDLVLAVLPVCEDLARQPVESGYFDWRQFELATLLVGQPAPEADTGVPATADDFESYLHGLGPQLAACRTPISDAMRSRWTRVFASLDYLIAGCRHAQVPVAVVIVPAEFQVNRPLCDTLLRRNGLSAERFDVELPQRRVARFAEHRKLQLIDLLPHFRLCRQTIFCRNTTVLNDEGNSAAAAAIGGWLQSRYGGQLAAQLSRAP